MIQVPSTTADPEENLPFHVKADGEMKTLLVVVGGLVGSASVYARTQTRTLGTARGKPYKKDPDKRGITSADGCPSAPFTKSKQGMKRGVVQQGGGEAALDAHTAWGPQK